jgi:peptidylprolyl isomerase
MNGKVKVLLLAIILSTLVLGCTAPAEKTVKAGDTVSVEYVGKLTDGTVFDTSNATIAKESGIYNTARLYEPLSFVAGANGTIKGFDEAVMGMRQNETKTNVTIPPEKAYGEYNASNVITAPLETLKGNNTNFSLYVGQDILYNDEYIYIVSVGATSDTARIVPLSRISPYAPYSINVNPDNTTATLNYNHPLAGRTLVFDITVVDIKSK